MIALAAELGMPQAVCRTGSLWVAQDEHERAEVERALSAAGSRCRPAADLIPDAMRDRCDTAAYFPRDAELLPATWVRTLAAAACDRGATLFERSQVGGLERHGDGWAVHAGGGTVHAQAVVVACDGLIPRLLPQLDGIVYPVRGQVLATEPLQQSPLHTPPTPNRASCTTAPPATAGSWSAEAGSSSSSTSTPTWRPSRLGCRPAGRVSVRVAGPRRRAGDPPVGRDHGILGRPAAGGGRTAHSPGLYVAGGYSGVGNVLGHLCGGIAADLIATGTHPQSPSLDVGRFDLSSPVQQLEKRRSREHARRLSLAQP